MQPDAIRIKLEIARCHLRLGAFETAKQYFRDVLTVNPPDAVRDNIDLYLAAIAATEKRHFFSGSVTYGFSADNNVRSAPGNFLLTFSGFGGIVTLPLTSLPVNDQIQTVTLTANHIYKFEDSPFSWKTSLLSFNSFYNDFKDLNLNYYGLTTGPVYQAGNYQLEAHAVVNNITLGYDEYVQPTGLGASATYIFGQKLIGNAAIGIEKKKYAKISDSWKSATNLKLTLTPIVTLNKNRITGTIEKERENAKLSSWSYDRLKWALRYDRILPKDFTAFGSIDIATTKYDTEASGATVVRSDALKNISLGLSKILWQSENKDLNLSGQLSYTYTDSTSSIDTYDYSKKVYATQLSLSFQILCPKHIRENVDEVRICINIR